MQKDTDIDKRIFCKAVSAGFWAPGGLVGPAEPGAPTIGVATAGNGTATFAFVAPANTGGHPILEYQVLLINAISKNLNAPATSITVTTANGSLVTGAVRARNAIGWGAWSAQSNAVTPSAGAGTPTLPFFSAALAARKASPSKVRQARIMTHGHSWTSGGGSGTSDGRDPGGSDKYLLINSIPGSWSQKLCEYLTTAGVKTVRNGFMGQQRGPVDAYQLDACDPRVKFSSGVVPGSNPTYIGTRAMSLPGNGTNEWLEFTPGFNFTHFKVWANRSINVYSEDVEVFVDDVSATHINANAGGTYYAFPGAVVSDSKYNYPGRKIRFVNRSATKSLQISGIECFGGAFDNSDVFLTMSGHSAATVADLVAGGASDYAAINAIPNYKCDLLIIQGVVNDANGAQAQYTNNGGSETALAVTLERWKTNIKLLYTKNPNCDIIIVGDPDAPVGSASPMIIQRYHTAAQEIIAEMGRGVYVDLRLVWGTYSDSIALGYRNYPTDTLHPSTLGHVAIGNQLGAVIAAGI